MTFNRDASSSFRTLHAHEEDDQDQDRSCRCEVAMENSLNDAVCGEGGTLEISLVLSFFLSLSFFLEDFEDYSGGSKIFGIFFDFSFS